MFQFRISQTIQKKILPFMNSRKKYGVKCIFFNYLQVLSAIPKHLLQKTGTLPPIDKRNILHNTISQLSSSITIDLAKTRCKDYYWLYISTVKIEPTGPKKWVKDLSLINFNWKQAFTQISQVCKGKKLREFNFKLLPRIIVNSKELHTYGIQTNSKYVYCDEPDSILHSYVECQHSQTFFNKVVTRFDDVNDSRFSPTVIEKLFGIMEQSCNDRKLSNLNYCLLFAKYFVYCRKLNKNKCDFNEFITKLQSKLRIEFIS